MLNLAFESEYSALPSLLSETLLHVQPHSSLFHFVVLQLEGLGGGREGGKGSDHGYDTIQKKSHIAGESHQ